MMQNINELEILLLNFLGALNHHFRHVSHEKLHDDADTHILVQCVLVELVVE